MRIKPMIEGEENSHVDSKGNVVILRILLVSCLLAGLYITVCSVAQADGPDPIILDVKSGTLNDPVGAGFEHITSVSILKITLKHDGAPVTQSEIVPADTILNLWSRDGGQDKWKTAGIKPNDKFYAVFKAARGGGGGGTTSWDYGSVSDVDIDADTDNDSQANPRVPDGENNEDEAEYATGDTGANGPRGLVMWVEDGAGGWESPWCRMDLAVDAKTTGQLKLNWDNNTLEMKINGGATITPEYTVPPNPLAKNGTPTHPQFLVRPKATTTQPANVEITATFRDWRDKDKEVPPHKEAVDKIKVSIINQCYLTLAVNNTAQTDDDYAQLDGGPRIPVKVTLLPAVEPPGGNTAPYTVTIREVDANGDPATTNAIHFYTAATGGTTETSLAFEMDWDEEKQQHTFYITGRRIGDAGPKYIQAKVTSEGETNPPQTARSKVTLVHFALGVDPDHAVELDDFPAEGAYPRSPGYMFTQNSCIYIQVRGLGTDPNSQETLHDAVVVTSESCTNGVRVTLRETGNSTGIFLNYLGEPDLLGQRLKVWHESGHQGLYDLILVRDEEVLTFNLKNPDNRNVVIAQKEVMVDRAEFGYEWQMKYDEYASGYKRLKTAADAMASKLNEKLSAAPFSWTKNISRGDLDCKESHIKSPTDDTNADSVDMFAWTGHATTDDGSDAAPNFLVMFVKKVGGAKQEPDKVYYSEISLGNVDAEWMIFHTCRYLNKNDNALKSMMAGTRGAHLLLGYVTGMDIKVGGKSWPGLVFGEEMKTRRIKNAWHEQVRQCQDSGRKARVFGATSAKDDMAVNVVDLDEAIPLSRDPIAASTYTHWDYLVP